MLEYSGGSISGTAFVASNTIGNAISYLKNNGYFNGTPQVYQIQNIQKITTTDVGPALISEIYKNPAKIAEKVRVPSEPDKKPEDNTMESIIENNKSKVLYVDRIGSVKTKLNHRNKGYLMMQSPSSINPQTTEGPTQLGHLYLWDGAQWLDLGMVKSKDIREVRSARGVIDVKLAESQGWKNNCRMDGCTDNNQYPQEPTWYKPVGDLRVGLFLATKGGGIPRLYRMLSNPDRYRRVIREFTYDLKKEMNEEPLLYETDNGTLKVNTWYRPLLGISGAKKDINTEESPSGFALSAYVTVKLYIAVYKKKHIKTYTRAELSNPNLVDKLCRNRLRFSVKSVLKTFYLKIFYDSRNGTSGDPFGEREYLDLYLR